MKQYLVALTECMSFGDKNSLVDCVADLIDLFDYVDVNGDGYDDILVGAYSDASDEMGI